jgi:predicted membrane GTPase involved in stress response
VINKIDRPTARPDWVLNQTFDFFDKLGATDEQLDFQSSTPRPYMATPDWTTACASAT